MQKSIILGVLLCSLVATICASTQHVLTHRTNALRANDAINGQYIEPVSIGDYGENVMWNFTRIINTGDYKLYYTRGEDTDSLHLYGISPEFLYKYHITEDTMACVGLESPLQYITYTQPEVILTFPFSYGDSIHAPFCAHGVYCGTNRIDLQGETIVEADGYGSIVLENDTLYDILRVHSIRSNSINMNLLKDSTVFDPANLKQEIRESYTWYGKGFRYPLFNVESRTLYNNMTEVSSTTKSYCFLPENQRLLNDSTNESIYNGKEQLTKASIIQYNVCIENGNVSLYYSLEEDANISILLSDRMGMIHRKTSTCQHRGSDYRISIPYYGLAPGIYILYINVNGMINSEKVNI